MEALIFVVLGGTGIYLCVAYQAKTQRDAALAATTGRLLHLRSAGFPATCTWCKNTSLGHKLMVFEQRGEGWRPYDVRAGLAQLPDAAVEDAVDAMFKQPSPRWRRFCTERCASESFASEHIDAVASFGPCGHCGARFPMALVHCPNCGAVRTSPGG